MLSTKVVSIICKGHSGSTLLDMLLGMLPKAATCGEMQYIPYKIYKEIRPEKYVTTYCSCGESMINCPFWRPVLESVSEKSKIDIFKYPEKFNICIHRPFYYGENLYYKVFRNLILKSSEYVNPDKIIGLLYPFYQKSINNNWILFDVLNETAGKELIIDSSKDIIRYLFLRKQRRSSVKMIILVRDVFGVATTCHNVTLTDELIQTRAQSWLQYYNIRLYNIIKHLNSSEYLIVRYEDLANDVNQTMKSIALFLDIKDNVPEIRTLHPSQTHIVAGNPVRLKEQIEIKYDERWRQRLTADQINLLSGINDKLSPIFKTRVLSS